MGHGEEIKTICSRCGKLIDQEQGFWGESLLTGFRQEGERQWFHLVCPGQDMKILELKRVYSGKFGTFGVLCEQFNPPFALTLERQWQNNERGKSCIPTGEYLCKRVTSPKFGDTFEVTGVTGRSEILFHKGNIEDDSHGCIVVGESFEPVKTVSYGIVASAQGFGEFSEVLKNESEFKLVIKAA